MTKRLWRNGVGRDLPALLGALLILLIAPASFAQAQVNPPVGVGGAIEVPTPPAAVEPAEEPAAAPEPAAVPEPAAAPEPAAVPEPAAAPEVEEPPAAPAVSPAPPAAAPAPPAAVKLAFNATKRIDGVIVLSGDVPSEPARRYLASISGSTAIDQMSVAAGGETNPFMQQVNAGMRALMALSEGRLQLRDGRWSLRGKAPDLATQQHAQALVAALPDAARWSVAIDGPPPFAVCTAQMAEFDARNPILFRSGSAVLAEQSTPALDELAGYLLACPDAAVHVEGHTDADGSDDLNLILSVTRAEAVVAALVSRGVAEERLYAIGYGESQPIAPNDTQDGKQRNRRIVVTVVDESR